jgi:uncharacterized repeat protein (TIGR01451 family)
VTVNSLTITDTVSPVLTAVVAQAPAAFGAPVVTSVAGGTRYVWTATGLNFLPGTEYSFTIAGRLGLVCASTPLSNRAHVEVFGACAASDVDTGLATMTLDPPVGNVTVVLNQVPASPGVGDAVTYRVVVTNAGTATVTDLTVTDTVSPAIVGAVTDQPAGWAAPVVTQTASGTQYAWARNGFAMVPGASYTFTISGTVGAVCVTSGVSNTAYVVALDSCLPSRQFTNTTGFVVAAPGLGLAAVKQAVPAAPQVGEPLAYRIVVTNTGTVTVNTMTVTDTVSPVLVGVGTAEPSGFGPPTIVSIVGTGTRYAWSASSLNLYPGTAYTFTITGVVGLVCAATNVSGTAYVIGGAACGETAGYTNAVGHMVQPPVSGMTVVKQQVPAAPGIGAAITYRIVVTNTGSATLTSLTVTDTVSPIVTSPANDQPAAMGAPVITSVAGTGTRYAWSATGLALVPGTSYTFTVTGTVGTVCAATTVGNTAWVTAGAACGPLSSFYTNATGFAIPAPALGFVVTRQQVPASPQVGEPLTYRLIVANTGGATVTDLTVTDTVSPVLTGVGTAEPSGFGPPAIVSIAGAGTRYAWSAGALAFFPGTAYTFTISGTVGLVCAPTGMAGTGYVTAQSTCAWVQNYANTTGHVVMPPVTTITVANNQVPASPAGTGSVVSYQIAVTNTGSATVSGLTLVDTVSPVITAATTTQPGGWGAPVVTSLAGTGTRYAWTNNAITLNPGATLNFTVDGTVGDVLALTSVSNTACAVATTACALPGAQSNAVGFTVGSSVALNATIASSAATVSTGQVFNVYVTVQNTGAGTATNVSTTLWKSSGAVSTLLTGLSAPTTANIASGFSVVYTWTATALSAGTVAWSATASAAGPFYAALVTTPGITVQAAAALESYVSANPPTMCAGQNYDVMVTVTNTGSAAANAFAVGPPAAVGNAIGNVPVSGPTPAVPASLGGGASQTFTWVYTAAAPAGAGTYSANATGTDANSGSVLASGAALASIMESSPAVLAAAITNLPANASTGQSFLATLSVDNTGGTPAVTLVPAAYFGAGVTLTSGPSPASLPSLANGGNIVFSWTFTANVAGPVSYTFTASGVGCSGNIGASDTGVVTVQDAANLTASLVAAPAAVVAGQLVVVTMTVNNTGAVNASAVTAVLTAVGATGIMGGPVPASAAIAGGGNATFEFTFTTTGGGSLTFNGSAQGTDALGGFTVTSASAASGSVAVTPAANIVASMTLDPVGTVNLGRTLTATLVVSNTGGAGANVTVAYTETKSDPFMLGAALPASPAGPFAIAGGTSQSLAWTYYAVRCGTGSINVSATGLEAGTGRALGPVSAGALVRVAGLPATVVASTDRVSGMVGTFADLTFDVYDNCSPTPQAVPNANVTMTVVSGGGSLLPTGGNTDTNGRLTTRLKLGNEAGINLVRGEVVGGTNPAGSVTVTGTVPSEIRPFLTRNSINPLRGEKVQIRVMVPAAMKVHVRVYNVAGELIRVVQDAEVNPGLSIYEWDGRNDNGAEVGNGSYFIQIVTGTEVKIRRINVVKM